MLSYLEAWIPKHPELDFVSCWALDHQLGHKLHVQSWSPRIIQRGKHVLYPMFVCWSLLHFSLLGCPPSGFGEHNSGSDTRLLLWNVKHEKSVGQKEYLKDSPLFFHLARYRIIGNKVGWEMDSPLPRPP